MATIKEKAKKAVQEVTRVLFGDEQNFTDQTLSDGTTVIRITGDIKDGSAVTDTDGNPIADGDYTLSDGTVITCAGGVITSVKAPETSTETEMTTEQMKAAMQKFATVAPGPDDMWMFVKALMEYNFGWQIAEDQRKQAITAYQTTMNAQAKKITDLEASNKKITEAFRYVMEVVQELANEPAAESAEKNKGSFGKEPITKDEQIQKLKDIMENYRKNK